MKKNKFDFTVELMGQLKYPEAKKKDWSFGLINDKYMVYLPHSCDEWTITISKDRDEAIKDLKLFIEEAREALKLLEKK